MWVSYWGFRKYNKIHCNNFEIYSVLKKGWSSSQLLETAIQDTEINHDVILIMCSDQMT